MEQLHLQKRIAHLRKRCSVFLPLVYAIVILEPFLSESCLSFTLVIMGLLFLTPFELGKPRMLGKICLCLFGILELILVTVAFLRIR